MELIRFFISFLSGKNVWPWPNFYIIIFNTFFQFISWKSLFFTIIWSNFDLKLIFSISINIRFFFCFFFLLFIAFLQCLYFGNYYNLKLVNFIDFSQIYAIFIAWSYLFDYFYTLFQYTNLLCVCLLFSFSHFWFYFLCTKSIQAIWKICSNFPIFPSREQTPLHNKSFFTIFLFVL